MSETPSFRRVAPREWSGRYARVPGEKCVMHLRSVAGRTAVAVRWDRGDETGWCATVDGSASRDLAGAVLSAKQQLGGGGGGSFVINEFRQVIVPASDGGGRRLLVGEVVGSLRFHNPFEPDEVFDLAAPSSIKAGDPWDRPYVGMPYHLSKRNELYFWRVDEDGGRKELPVQQDTGLISAIRLIRRFGAVRFLVNHEGIVLTKRPAAEAWQPEEQWEPVFVGRIDFPRWFPKEA